MLSSLASNDIDTSLELDSHADTYVIGKYCLILNDYERPVTVYGYERALGAKSFRTLSAVLGYIDPKSGQTYHLVIHQVIKIPHLEHSLLFRMQCRMNGVEINETPCFLEKKKTPNSHAIFIDDPNPISNATVTLPLSLSGVTSYLPVHKTSLKDWYSGKYPRYELTSEHLDWNPSDPTFDEQKDEATGDVGSFVDRYASAGDLNLYIRAFSSSVPQADISEDDNLGNVLLNKVQVLASARAISTAQTKKQAM